jgi:aminopeptidase N
MATNAFAEWHSGGGLNLRGYNGYYAIDQNNAGTIYTNYKGRSGAAINLEVDVDNYFSKIRPKYLRDYLHLDVYAFADAGVMSRGVYDATNITALQPVNAWSRVRMDAGIGTAWTIKKFGPFEKMAPFTLRFDMPFFLSSTPYAKPENLAWRWVMGVNRAF